MQHVKIKGLMCIPPPLKGDGSELRKNFECMKNTFEELKNHAQDSKEISVLSMGMSDDFDIAIEHGSTLVRVGSAIFGLRNYG